MEWKIAKILFNIIQIIKSFMSMITKLPSVRLYENSKTIAILGFYGLSITAICPFSNIFQRLTVPRMIDQFGRKTCQKKRKDVDYKLL